MDDVEMQGQTPTKRKRGRPKKQESQIAFVGFTQASIHDEYFRMPTIWINVCAEIDNLAELKVVQYVLRHTWGHRDYGTAKHITVDEFMNGRKYKRGERQGERMDNGTGLSESAVREGLERAIKHGFLVCYVDDHDQARVEKYYALKMQEEAGEQFPEEEYYLEEETIDTDSEVFNKSGEVFNKYPGGIKQIPRTEERTLEQTYRTKDIREASISSNVSQEEEKIRYLPPLEQRKGNSHATPAFLRDVMDSLSRDLGDHEHIPSNISQANKLYGTSGLDPDAFLDLLYEVKDLARKASIKKVNSKGWPNRMPYFFKCLRKILTPEEAQA